MTELVSVTYHIQPDQKDVLDAAQLIIAETMKEGAATNGTGSWCNKDPLNYHARKAMLHICSLWDTADLEAREREEPRLKHLYNAVTRLCMAEALRKQRKIPPAQLEEEIPE